VEHIFHDGLNEGPTAFSIHVLKLLNPLFLAAFNLRIVRQHNEVDMLLFLIDCRQADEVDLLRRVAVAADDQYVQGRIGADLLKGP